MFDGKRHAHNQFSSSTVHWGLSWLCYMIWYLECGILVYKENNEHKLKKEKYLGHPLNVNRDTNFTAISISKRHSLPKTSTKHITLKGQIFHSNVVMLEGQISPGSHNQNALKARFQPQSKQGMKTSVLKSFSKGLGTQEPHFFKTSIFTRYHVMWETNALPTEHKSERRSCNTHMLWLVEFISSFVDLFEDHFWPLFLTINKIDCIGTWFLFPWSWQESTILTTYWSDVCHVSKLIKPHAEHS
jgi:hypothetical protein